MKNMTNISFFCPIWGMKEAPLAQRLHRIQSSGYDGFEFGLKSFGNKPVEVKAAAKDAGLKIIGQECEAEGKDFKSHKVDYIHNLKKLIEYQPDHINCHTGKDFFSMEENLSLFEAATAIEKEYGIPITHETHRGKALFSLINTLEILNNFPELKLTGDFSHFCVVSESYLEDQEPALQALFPHVHHLHARVGHPQGPQVTDPSLPEWDFALQRHLSWWDAVIALQRHTSPKKSFPITVEFGPYPYMPAVPFTQQPQADQWELNINMKDLLNQRYN